MSEPNQCICPVIEIKCKPGQITDSQQDLIADLFNASVARDCGPGNLRCVYGKHLADCPCNPDEEKPEA